MNLIRAARCQGFSLGIVFGVSMASLGLLAALIASVVAVAIGVAGAVFGGTSE